MRAEEIGVDERHTRVRKHTPIKRIKKGKERKRVNNKGEPTLRAGHFSSLEALVPDIT